MAPGAVPPPLLAGRPPPKAGREGVLDLGSTGFKNGVNEERRKES